jgi:hypothetical protein
MKKILLQSYLLLIIVLPLFPILHGCRNSENPVQPNGLVDNSISVSALEDSILYKLSIPSDSISTQDSLRASFLLINQGKTQRLISSPDSPILQWALRDSSGNSVMQDGPSHHLVYRHAIAPSDSLIFNIKRKIMNISPGSYRLDASLYYPEPASPVLSLQIILQ